MKNFFTLLGLATLVVLSGCKQLNLTWEDVLGDNATSDFSFDETYKPKYVLTFHQIVKYPRGSLLEKKITTYTGNEIWINSNQFLSSKNIKSVKLIKRPNSGLYDLLLNFDSRGKMQWNILALNFRGRKIALLIDGVFYRKITAKMPSGDSDSAVLEGPCDTLTAKNIQKYAPKNYKHYNDKE